MPYKLILTLIDAPWRSEMELGEAGIRRDFIVVDEAGKHIGKYVQWHNGESGLFVGDYPGKVDRVVLPAKTAMVEYTTEV